MSAHATNYNILRKVFVAVENILRTRVNVSVDITHTHTHTHTHTYIINATRS